MMISDDLRLWLMLQFGWATEVYTDPKPEPAPANVDLETAGWDMCSDFSSVGPCDEGACGATC
jgi:hypothetical protein